MRSRSFAFLAVLTSATIFVQAQSYTFTTLDYPGATMTNPNAVSGSGVVVGDYFDNTSGPHGFAYYNGHFVAINVPNATFTSATDINNGGTVSGFFRDQSGTHGFVWREGSFRQVDFPAATLWTALLIRTPSAAPTPTPRATCMGLSVSAEMDIKPRISLCRIHFHQRH